MATGLLGRIKANAFGRCPSATIIAATSAAAVAAAAGTAAVARGHGRPSPVTSCSVAENRDRTSDWKNVWASKANHWLPNGEPSWHHKDINPYLQRHLKELLPGAPHGSGQRVFFPLCGKSVDMAFLCKSGYQVVGAEGSPHAIEEFAKEHSATGEAVPMLVPSEISKGPFLAHAIMPKVEAHTHTHKEMQWPVTILQGDFFSLSPEVARALGPFDAAFDRGALGSVDPEDRTAYIKILADLIAPGGRVLLVVTEHGHFKDGSLGPPWNMTEAEVRALCAQKFAVKQLELDMPVPGKTVDISLQGVYLLTRQRDTQAQ